MKGTEGDAFFYGWIGDNGDADNFLSLLDSNQIDSSLNSAKYKNAKVDGLLKKGSEVLDSKARIKIYQDLQKILIDEAPWVFVSHAIDLAAYRPQC